MIEIKIELKSYTLKKEEEEEEEDERKIKNISTATKENQFQIKVLWIIERGIGEGA